MKSTTKTNGCFNKIKIDKVVTMKTVKKLQETKEQYDFATICKCI